VDAVSMEVSSHAIDLHRVDAVRFEVAAFTNLSQDHLDYHETLEQYFSVKRRLFTELGPGIAVVNIDDPAGETLARDIDPARLLTVGRAATARVTVTDECPGPVSTDFILSTPQGQAPVTLPLPGAFNVSNALVAAGCAYALGIPLETIAIGLSRAPQVPGRLERVEAGQPFSVLVDYAHTPDGLEKAIAAVRAVTPGRLITVFGCGGDRDPDKRLPMGRAAGEGSDLAIATSDNPRSEDPVGILLAVEDGLKASGGSYETQVDRRHAIARAMDVARAGDAVLIAGKGHEDYQIFSDRTIHFDDREVAREELEKRWS
jgi:UDP-N-acetylmuramoyl-L-alanyl-D-glutamate--2,6-diaminopimelate ligase